jgi:hypothetical protein
MTIKSTQLLPAFLAAAGLLLSACGEKATEEKPSAETKSDDSALSEFVVEEAHAELKQISEVFAKPEPGTEVVIGGEVMGRMNPFIDGRAMVVLGDPTKLTPCNRRPGDECTTPWDVCCDLPEVIKSSITTVQFVDDDGKIIKSSLKGFNGIKELSYLTVAGTIAEGSNAENLLINATEVHVAKESPYKETLPISGHGNEAKTAAEEAPKE